MNYSQQLKIARINNDAIIPKYAKEGDAGFDFHSVDDYEIHPGKRELIKTGMSVAVPQGYELQIRPRSGLAYKHGISVVNSPGTVDSGYRGEIGIILINHGHEVFSVKKGDRIAQGVLNQVTIAEFVEVSELSETDRGAGGFGHTGQ